MGAVLYHRIRRHDRQHAGGNDLMVKRVLREIEELNHGLTSVLQTSIDIRLNDIDSFAAQLQMNAVNLKLSRSKRS